jgi:hypothetical protein
MLTISCMHCSTQFQHPIGARGVTPRYCSAKCRNGARYARLLERKDDARRCAKCGETKPATEFAGVMAPYCHPCMAVYARQRYKDNTAQHLNYARTTNLRRYNLTMADFEQLLAEQGGKCAVCRCDEPGGQGKWHVDHDHSCCSSRKISCGKCIRGLLCSRCNIGIGNLRDDPAVIRAAADYLDAHAARRASHVLTPAV